MTLQKTMDGSRRQQSMPDLSKDVSADFQRLNHCCKQNHQYHNSDDEEITVIKRKYINLD